MHDVAVLHDIILAFEPHLAGIAGAGLTAAGHIILVGDRLGADEAALEIAMDDAAACGALAPRVTVQARASFGPAVKKVTR